MDKKQVADLLNPDQQTSAQELQPTNFLDKKDSLQIPQTVEQLQPNIEQEQTETHPEQESEQGEKDTDSAVSKMKSLLTSSKKSKQIIPQVRDEVVLELEHILEDGLSDAFTELSPIEQQQFKIKGEETAFAIRDMMRRQKLKVRSVFKLILDWLKLLPGVNRFFLQQEAKIKVDKIVSLHKRSTHKHL